MRDLQYYARECMEELDNIGIEYGNIVEFKVNTRAASRWGRCKSVPGGYTIDINVALLNERNDLEGLKNTIIHELLHSISGCMNHGEKWKKLADKINRTYGYNIKRCSSSDEKGVDENTKIKRKTLAYKYAVKCKCCGTVIKRKRVSNVIKYPTFYKCGKCGGKLERIA